MISGPTIQELIDLVRRDTDGDDPLDRLTAAVVLAGDLVDTADAVLGHYVDQARRSGQSWVEISQVLGVSKQAVHKRFSVSDRLPLFLSDGKPAFERFTGRTRNVIKAAESVATEEMRQSYVGTEHLLLGMYAEPTAVATRILTSAGITKDQVITAVRERTPDGTEVPEGRPPLTRWAANSLSAAAEVADELGHNYVGTEHLLLAIYRNPEALAVQILTELGLDADAARAQVIKLLEGFRK